MADDGSGTRRLIVVDAANVVGSVPDGWWRDRFGATERLRDRLVTLGPELGGDLVLVVEGRARGVPGIAGVRVVPAPGSGDDTIVDLVREHLSGGGDCVVVTADRGLRARVGALGASVRGPATVRPKPDTSQG